MKREIFIVGFYFLVISTSSSATFCNDKGIVGMYVYKIKVMSCI